MAYTLLSSLQVRRIRESLHVHAAVISQLANDAGRPVPVPDQGEAVGCGPREQQLEKFRPLPGCEPWWSSRRRLGPQGLGAPDPDGALTTTDRRWGTADPPGDRRHLQPLIQDGEGPTPLLFPLYGAAIGSRACQRTIVPLPAILNSMTRA